MSIRQILTITVLIIAAATAGFLLARGLRDGSVPRLATPAPGIGDPAPALALADVNGAAVDWAQFAGKPLVLNFWASWCPPCVKEMPLLDEFARTHPDIQVLGVAVEPARAARDYLVEHPVAYRILLGSEFAPDESALLGNSRGVLPYTVLIGADGRIRKRRAGAFAHGELEDWVR